jgi:hypothetical protein
MAGTIAQQTENKYEAIRELQNLHLDAAFTIGVEASNAINVAVQLKSDKSQAAITVRRQVRAYLSGVSTGATVVGSAPSGGAAIGTNGAIIASITANKVFDIVTDASGRFDLTLTETSTPTFYLVVVMPNGRLVISGAITFA